MKKYCFTIIGNHKSLTGNAVPKLKMTGKQHWTERAQEYVAWKSHVQYSFMNSLKGDRGMQRMFVSNMARFKKPFLTGKGDLGLMVIKIQWANKAHGDPENIFGSIADALFTNDKNLDCVAVADMSRRILNGKPVGSVEVTIRLFFSSEEKEDFYKKQLIIQ